MTLVFHDPTHGAHPHEYLTKVFFKGLRQYLHANGRAVMDDNVLEKIHNATVLTSADYLNREAIYTLKNNGNKIVGFSITDSSYIAQPCREAHEMFNVDLIFAATGLQKINEGREFIVDENFNISLEKREFLPEEDWIVYRNMRERSRLQSLPYIHWTALPDAPVRPYSERSQKVVMRGGLHARRFILALFLMRQDLLDVNSGFITAPYFADSMNPQFQYCADCRHEFHRDGRASYFANRSATGCNSPARIGNALDWSLENLGQWNNRCPRSFYWMGEQFEKQHGHISRELMETICNAQWLTSEAHQELLGRITFTSDLKWLFSIYTAQRFWDAAAAGCVNVLPSRTVDQEYFPVMEPEEHYTVFDEDFSSLPLEFQMNELAYNRITEHAKALYDEWIVPGRFALNENLCRHIIQKIEEHAA